MESEVPDIYTYHEPSIDELCVFSPKSDGMKYEYLWPDIRAAIIQNHLKRYCIWAPKINYPFSDCMNAVKLTLW
jgi:hypothetical protein